LQARLLSFIEAERQSADKSGLLKRLKTEIKYLQDERRKPSQSGEYREQLKKVQDVLMCKLKEFHKRNKESVAAHHQQQIVEDTVTMI
jgi:hypothetical protein